MNIFFASQSFYPHIGGVSTYLLNLAKGLKERGYNVAEVHLRPPHESSEEEIQGIKVYRVPKEPLDPKWLEGYSCFKEIVWNDCHGRGKGFKKDPAEMRGFEEFNEVNLEIGKQIEQILENQPAELVHIHDFQLLFLYRHIPRGMPLILTWHIPFTNQMSKNLRNFLIKHMMEFDKIIFSSKDYIKEAVKAGLPKEKAELIHPIANTVLFVPKKPNKKIFRKYNVPKNAKIIMCVQRIDSKSGHQQLINAMPKILEKVPEAALVFVGGKSLSQKISNTREKYEKKIQKLIEHRGLQKNVFFTGNVQYEKLAHLYSSADVIALTSRNEGFGLSVTEGMACGKPVVGTNVGGIPLQVKDGFNGFLVKQGDVKATADRLTTLLLDSKLRKKMGQNALKTVEQKFKMEIGIEKHIALYTNLLQEKSHEWNLRMIKFEKISAIIADLDRMFYTKPGVKKKEAIRKLDALGKPFILVTTKGLQYVKSLYKQHPCFDAIAAESGAIVYFPKSDKVIRIDSVAMAKAREIARESMLKLKIGKVGVSIPKKAIPEMTQKLKRLSKKLTFIENGAEIIVLPDDVDKGTGAKLAMQQLGIEPEKSIVIGYGENDTGLFNVPGFKVTVSNANQELKDLADQTAKKADCAGLLEIVRELRK